MKIEVSVSSYKSIGHVQLELRPGVNVLIGPNGSGKSNVLSSLKFIRDVLTRGAGLAVARAGGPVRVYRRGQKRLSFGVSFDYGPRTHFRRQMPHRFEWEFEVGQAGPERVATILKESAKIFAVDGNRRTPVLSCAVDRVNRTSQRNLVHLAGDEVVGRDLFSNSSRIANGRKAQMLGAVRERLNAAVRDQRKNPDASILPLLATLDSHVSQAYSAFQNLNEYDILPSVAREATDQIPVAEMLPNGKNLTEVIDALERRNVQRLGSRGIELDSFALTSVPPDWRFALYPMYYRPYRHVRELDKALDRINQELSGAIHTLDGVSVGVDLSNGKRFTKFVSGDDFFFPEEVSDGTMKWLGILVSLFVPFSIVYLIEEPENFLHPWMQQRLIELMRERSQTRRMYFVLTTHSATMLNAAQPDEVTLVTPSRSGTLLKRATAAEEVRNILESSDFGLGDLWVSGAIGAVPGDAP